MTRKKLLRRTLPAAFLLLCALTLFFFSRYTKSGEEAVALTPVPTDAQGWDIYTFGEGGMQSFPTEEVSRSARTIYLSRRLDPAWEEAGYTYLELGSTWQFSLFLDDTLFYTTTPGSGDRVGEVAFPAEYAGVGEPVRCTLPPGFGGRTLTVAARRAGEYPDSPAMALTCGEIITRDNVALTNRLGMPAAVFAAAALCLLGLFCYDLFRGKRDWPLLLLALAAACQSLYWLREFDMRFNLSLPLDIPLAAVFPQLFLLLPLAYLMTCMGRWRRWCACSVGFLGAAALLRPVWDVPPCPVWIYDALMLSCVAVTLVFAGLELAGGNRMFFLFFKASALLCAVFLLCCVLSPSLGRYGTAALSYALGGDAWLLLPLLGVGFFLVCAFLSAYQTVRRAADDQTELALLTARDELNRENLRIMQESGMALVRTRHDMLGNLGILQSLCREGEYEKLGEYLARLTRQTSEIVPLKMAAHPIVNAILTQGAERARKAGVQLRCQVCLPETLPVPDEDLAAFLMNLLSNALEAAADVPEGQPRWVEITMHIRGKCLFIEGRNTCTQATVPEGGGRFRSAKGPGHGYGLKIMEGVARRYQSELRLEAKDGIFTARTALLMP